MGDIPRAIERIMVLLVTFIYDGLRLSIQQAMFARSRIDNLVRQVRSSVRYPQLVVGNDSSFRCECCDEPGCP